MRDCVVTGIGLVSCLGIGAAEHFSALAAGRSGVARTRRFDPTGFQPVNVGEVPSERLRAYAGQLLLPPASLRHRRELLAVTAMSDAWQDAGGDRVLAGLNPTRISVVLGSGLFVGPEPVDWIFAPAGIAVAGPVFRMLDGTATFDADGSLDSLVAISGAKGRLLELNSACAASGHALGLGQLLIRGGHADLVFAAGVDAIINPIGIGAFQMLGVTSTRAGEGARACRPFDLRRDGTVIGEGAAVLILETRHRAEQRRHPIWGTIEGCGFSADGFSVTAPHAEGAGARRAMAAALRAAGRAPQEVQYLNAHGTGTLLNDAAEVKAIKDVFGDSARQLWISATKPMTGHLIAAAGGLEAAITFLTLNSGVVFPTLNLDRPDPAFGLDFVPMEARLREVGCAMSNCFGLGGQNCCLVLGAPEPRRAISTL